MRELINPSTQAQFNLALEEFILTKHSEEYFFLWQDEPAIIVGRNQNTKAEINEDFVKTAGIDVVRRLTGGGAVYHDLGNLNFTMIINDPGGVGFDFKRFTRPIIKALARMGVVAKDTGRNDLTIAGKKFSGNAQYRHAGRLLHHGTLLFSSDLSVLGAALKVKPQKIASKGVKSVQSRVTNIIDYAPNLTLGDFRSLIAESLRQEYQTDNDVYLLDDRAREQVRDIQAKKYGSWDWNYGYSPAYDLVRNEHFDWGEVEIHLAVKNGLISAIKIYGDFFATTDLIHLEAQLIGVRYEKMAIVEKIANLELKKYLPQLDDEVFCKLIIE
ncbi:MAG: lipoate--protein ligase [Methylocystaceae bacterium]